MPRTPSDFAHLLICFAISFVLAGCTSLAPELPMTTADEISPQEESLVVRTLTADGQFEELPSSLIAQRLQTNIDDRPLSVLALSGGGAGGAFGAGAIVGLTHAGARPDFSVVTGVSAGALLAPYAFLGPQRDPDVKAIYTGGASQDLLRPRVRGSRVLGALFGSSLYSDVPLKRLIDRYVDDGMIQAVAAEAAKGRLLLVGTTDLAAGQPVIWDLGSIALHGGVQAGQLFRKVLLASASVPGMFPPVVIRYPVDGRVREETHVDGGVTLPFFVAPTPADLPASRDESRQRTLVRIVIDTRLSYTPRATKARAAAIFRRSVGVGLNHVMRTTLASTVASVWQRGIAVEYAAIPMSYPFQRAFDFDPQGQRSLFEYAFTCAKAGRLWTRVVDKEHRRTPDGPVAPEGPAAYETTQCPADDSFIARFGALEQ